MEYRQTLYPNFPVDLSWLQTWGAAAARPLGWQILPSSAIPIVVFVLRSIDQTLGTTRTLAVYRGQRAQAWALGFAQSFLFVTALSGVLQDLLDPLTWLAYAGGYGMGAVVGMTLDRRRSPGHAILRIISSGRGSAVGDRLRQEGRGVTELSGQGMEGMVSVMLCAVPQRQVERTLRTIMEVDPAAFVSAQYVRPLSGGWHP